MKLIKFVVALFILAQSCVSNPESVLTNGNGKWNFVVSNNSKFNGTFTFVKINNENRVIQNCLGSDWGYDYVMNGNSLIAYKNKTEKMFDLTVNVIDNNNVELINNMTQSKSKFLLSK